MQSGSDVSKFIFNWWAHLVIKNKEKTDVPDGTVLKNSSGFISCVVSLTPLLPSMDFDWSDLNHQNSSNPRQSLQNFDACVKEKSPAVVWRKARLLSQQSGADAPLGQWWRRCLSHFHRAALSSPFKLEQLSNRSLLKADVTIFIWSGHVGCSCLPPSLLLLRWPTELCTQRIDGLLCVCWWQHSHWHWHFCHLANWHWASQRYF